MNVNDETVLQLHKMEIREDHACFIVEDAATNEFYEMTGICVQAIRMMKDGWNVGQIETVLKKKYPTEEVNVAEFAKQLVELNLVYAVDGHPVAANQFGGKEKQSFQWIPPILGRIFFHKAATRLYISLFFVNIYMLCTHPSLFPVYQDLFVFDAMTLNIVVWMAVTLLLIFIHETGHILAMRAHDLSAKLGIGHRLFLVVLETDISSAWRLPREKRTLLYMAGLCFDNIVLFLALTAQLILPAQSIWLHGIMGIVVFDIMTKFLYQCCIYMKTDLYYVFENMTGCYNVMENGKQYIKKLLSFGRKPVHMHVFDGEEAVVKWYAILYSVGMGMMLFLFSVFYIPQFVYIAMHTIPGLLLPVTDWKFWDAVVLIAKVVIMTGLLLYTRRKGKLEANRTLSSTV